MRGSGKLCLMLCVGAVLLFAAACNDDNGVSIVCGDGNINGNEECDDGNRVNGDGCSSTCVIDLTGEYNLVATPAGAGTCPLSEGEAFAMTIEIEQIGDDATIHEAAVPGPDMPCAESTGVVAERHVAATGGLLDATYYSGSCGLSQTDEWALQVDAGGSVTGTWHVAYDAVPAECIAPEVFPCANDFTIAGTKCDSCGPGCSSRLAGGASRTAASGPWSPGK
jgi:cysteine-rich repeat protein